MRSDLKMTESFVAEALEFFTAPLPSEADKFANGKVAVIAGNYGMTGAAVLCASAAIRSGAGLVYSIVPGGCLAALEANLPEAVKIPAGDPDRHHFTAEDAEALARVCADADAIVIGPGLGRAEATTEFVKKLLLEEDFGKRAKAVVLDADGLYPFAGKPELLRAAAEKLEGRLIVTPHEGEAARLLGKTREYVHENREECARELAETAHGGAAVLKGHGTLIAGRSGGKYEIYENTTGNPGMGTGGSGDVLSGMTGAISVSAKDPLTAARYAAALHGLSGDIMAARYGERYIAASDLIKGLGELKRYAGQHESLGRDRS
jgi:NAD(P)H-hydrate epimerase